MASGSGRLHPNAHKVAPALSFLRLKMETLVYKIDICAASREKVPNVPT